MRPALRIPIGFLGAAFVLQGMLWLVEPTRAAEALGMPLLDGLARSTQIGDLSAFFLVAGACMVLGSRPGQARLLYLPAAMIGGAAITRTIAWAVHGAAFATTFIGVEVAVALLLLAAAQTRDAAETATVRGAP